MSPRRPTASAAAEADDWVRTGGDDTGASTPPAAREANRKLTFDIPESLHREMKIRAATTGVPMTEEVRRILESHYRGG